MENFIFRAVISGNLSPFVAGLPSQQTFTCLKLTKETLEKGVKYV